MATSLPTVVIESNTWTDIYAATGIAGGTQLIVQNTGTNTIRLAESATEPDTTTGHNVIPPDSYLTNAAANVGGWAYSTRGSRLQVEEA